MRNTPTQVSAHYTDPTESENVVDAEYTDVDESPPPPNALVMWAATGDVRENGALVRSVPQQRTPEWFEIQRWLFWIGRTASDTAIQRLIARGLPPTVLPALQASGAIYRKVDERHAVDGFGTGGGGAVTTGFTEFGHGHFELTAAGEAYARLGVYSIENDRVFEDLPVLTNAQLDEAIVVVRERRQAALAADEAMITAHNERIRLQERLKHDLALMSFDELARRLVHHEKIGSMPKESPETRTYLLNVVCKSLPPEQLQKVMAGPVPPLPPAKKKKRTRKKV